MAESGRWIQPKVYYIHRNVTLRNDNDTQDEYHIVLFNGIPAQNLSACNNHNVVKCAYNAWYYNEMRRMNIKLYNL